jgi:hypothetical protein
MFFSMQPEDTGKIRPNVGDQTTDNDQLSTNLS